MKFFGSILAVALGLLHNTGAIDDGPSDNWFGVISAYTEDGSSPARCGCILIHADLVLTAAGCVFDYVRIGYSDDQNYVANRTVVSRYEHPDARRKTDNFTFENLPNDLMIVKLDEPITNVIPAASTNALGVEERRELMDIRLELTHTY